MSSDTSHGRQEERWMGERKCTKLSEMQQGKKRFVAILLYCYAGKYKIIAF